MIVRVSLESHSNNDAAQIAPNTPPTAELIDVTQQVIQMRSRDKRFKLCMRSLHLAALAALLAFQQVQFARDGWATDCDYQFKIWATVTVGLIFLRCVVSMVRALVPPLDLPHAQHLTSSERTRKWVSHGLSFLMLIMSLFQLAWFIRGGILLFVQDGAFDLDTCPARAWLWSIVLWTWQALMYSLPCLLIIFLVPCVMFWFVFLRTQSDEPSSSTPEDVLSKLRRMPYADLMAEGFGDAAPPPGEAAEFGMPLNSPSAAGGSSNLLNALPDVMGVTHLLTRFGSRGAAAHRPPADHLANENTCAICFAEFEPQEIVIQLPCDRRHFFHDTCLTQWLERNQKCPMCRRNIVDIINDRLTP